MQVYRKGTTPGDSSITVEGRRLGATAIESSFTTGEMLCDKAYNLRVQFASGSRRTSILYEMTMQKVSVHGRRCS